MSEHLLDEIIEESNKIICYECKKNIYDKLYVKFSKDNNHKIKLILLCQTCYNQNNKIKLKKAS